MEEEDAQEILDEIPYKEIEPPRKRNFKDNKKEGIGLVKEAILDLDREISRIRKEKYLLNSEIRNVEQTIQNTEEVGKKVEKLRYLRRVSELEKKEAELIEKRKRLKQKEDSLDKKLNKVKDIKSKLSEV